MRIEENLRVLGLHIVETAGVENGPAKRVCERKGSLMRDCWERTVGGKGKKKGTEIVGYRMNPVRDRLHGG